MRYVPTVMPVGDPDPAHDRAMLETLQRETFDYFARAHNPRNGLVADGTNPRSSASIAAVGLALSTYPVAVERGYLSRREAIARTLAVLRFLHSSEQGEGAGATGHRGFYYHFLDMETGRRAGGCELSTIDSALLLAGVLIAGEYFDRDDPDETEIGTLADALYRRADWVWATNRRGALRHGWTPERGFLRASWGKGYSEAMILYVLALGSPTFATPPEGYRRWTATFTPVTAYDLEHLYAGPLFIHQLSHVWLDFRGVRDDRTRAAGFDYFENSRRATLVHRRYAIENPKGYRHYSKYGWGLSASDGPGPSTHLVDGVRRRFRGYCARGAPFGPDDGTIAPWAVVASLPFAPAEVCDTLHHAIAQLALRGKGGRGFDASINPTFPMTNGDPNGWASPWKFGLNEGPIVLMIENHLTGLLWQLSRRCVPIVRGMRAAGFCGGWLDELGSEPA